MTDSLAAQLVRRLPGRPKTDPEYVPELVDVILRAGREAAASDVHLCPSADGLQMKWRIDGVLLPVASFPRELAPRIIARLKVLANLLTYRTDTPQEGRLRNAGEPVELRLSVFPTLFGEKAVVRMFSGPGHYHRLDELGLPTEILRTLRDLLDETGGVILLTGPAGSGKTTTIYACLRELIDKSGSGRSLVTLEDPIEVIVPGVDQSQVNLPAGFDMPTGLRSLLRQDPDVMAVGEIRDRGTAETVFQASLTGHLILTTFHAGSAARAVSRLLDMNIEPYLLRSGLLAMVSQRLLRRLCACAIQSEDPAARLGLPVTQVRVPVGCPECSGTGYRGRMVVAEMLLPERGEVGSAILARSHAGRIEELAVEAGMVTQRARACQAVEAGQTSPQEVLRVFGLAPVEA